MSGRSQATLFCAVAVTALLAAPPSRAAPEDAAMREARALLQRMNTVLAQRNYVGTLRHERGGRAETLRIMHRLKDNEVAERIVPLDGSRREFIRRGPELITLMPDQGVALVERRPRAGGLFATLPQLDERASQVYQVAAVRRVRQQGRDSHLVTLEPRDGYRYGYRIWIDARTAMPLKTELRDDRGTVLEEVAFTELRLLADIPDADFRPSVPTANLRWYRSGPVPVAAAARGVGGPGWIVGRLPPGFRLTQSARQNLPGSSGPVEHLVFSDGIASVSVFIGPRSDPTPRAGRAGTPAAGSATTYVTRVEGRPVTVVGEVPLRTARFIALQVRPTAPPTAAPAATSGPAAAVAPTAPAAPTEPAAAAAPPR